MLQDIVKTELILLVTSICSFTHNCKQKCIRATRFVSAYHATGKD